jgi:hypothetical protein
MAEWIAAPVTVDAFAPNDGKASWDPAGKSFRNSEIDGATADGFSVTPPSAADPAPSHPTAAGG